MQLVCMPSRIQTALRGFSASEVIRHTCAIQIRLLLLLIILSRVWVVRSEPLCVVMELANNGSLQRLLRQQRRHGHAHNDDVVPSHAPDDDDVSDVTSQRYRLTSSDLILFAVHVASGMEYVASQRVRLNHIRSPVADCKGDVTRTIKLANFVCQ